MVKEGKKILDVYSWYDLRIAIEITARAAIDV